MGQYIKTENRIALANNLASIYTLEELSILKIDTRERWSSSPEPSVIRSYAWTCYSVIDDALTIKMQEIYDSTVNPAPAPAEEVSTETFIP